MGFSYRTFAMPHPLVSLGGRAERPRPVVTIGLQGPGGIAATQAILDTGSDDTIFSDLLAQKKS